MLNIVTIVQGINAKKLRDILTATKNILEQSLPKTPIKAMETVPISMHVTIHNASWFITLRRINNSRLHNIKNFIGKESNLLNGSIAIWDTLILKSSENLMSSWQILLGIFTCPCHMEPWKIRKCWISELIYSRMKGFYFYG